MSVRNSFFLSTNDKVDSLTYIREINFLNVYDLTPPGASVDG